MNDTLRPIDISKDAWYYVDGRRIDVFAKPGATGVASVSLTRALLQKMLNALPKPRMSRAKTTAEKRKASNRATERTQ